MLVDVEAGAGEPAVTERPHECAFVDDRSARGIDEDRRRLHCCEHGGVDEVAGGVVQGHVQR